MSTAQPQVLAAPFDAVAARYDETFTFSRIGQAQRAAVWRELAKTFQAGDRTLEIGCGTGVDACFLAEIGRASCRERV
jgi:ubiquinone/menaquinone biosynthesis C-methylase UbiE